MKDFSNIADGRKMQALICCTDITGFAQIVKTLGAEIVVQLLRDLATPTRAVVELRPGFKQDPIADTSRIFRCAGWRARIRLETTVSHTLAWWQQFRQAGR